MLALSTYEDEQICPVCGGPKAICQNPANDGRFDVPDPNRCFVASAIADKREKYSGAKYPQALTFGAYLRH